MSLWHIAWIYLWSRKFTTILTIISVALAVALITALLTIRDETRKRFEEEQAAFDVVVGPPGSPLQLVLNAVYFLDSPVGAMDYDDYLAVKAHEDVTNAFPVGLGDTYKGHAIVGTEVELFAYEWESIQGEKRNPFKLADGKLFDAPMQVVVGSMAAKATRLEVGNTFEAAHGKLDLGAIGEFDHNELYTVVGVLKPSGTSNDRAIFTDIQSYWDQHAEHGDEEEDDHDEKIVSAVLVDLYSSLQRFQFQEWATKDLSLTAAVPYQQILDLFNTVLQPAVIILIAVGYVVVVISALSIMIGLYLSIIQRKRDLAIMRALGAAASEIFGAVIIEAFLVTVIGIATGWVLGKAVAFGVGAFLSRSYGLGVHTVSTSPEEWGFFGIVGIVGLYGVANFSGELIDIVVAQAQKV